MNLWITGRSLTIWVEMSEKVEQDIVSLLEGKLRGHKGSEREQPPLRESGKAYELEELIEHFWGLTGTKRKELCQRGRSSL